MNTGDVQENVQTFSTAAVLQKHITAGGLTKEIRSPVWKCKGGDV